MKAKRQLLTMLCMVVLTAQAIPVRPGQWATLTLADGTTVRAELRGDEHGTWYQDAQGQCYVRQGDSYVVADTETIAANQRQNRRASRRVIFASTNSGLGYKGRCSGGTMYSIGEYDIPVLMVEFSDTKFSPESTEDLGYLAPTISRMFETSTTLKKYASQWDGGRLMTNVRNWAQNSCTSKVLFVYAKNDPWTGGSPWWNNGTMGSPTLENVRQLVLQNTVHNNFIYIERYFSPTEKQMLTSAIDVLLK